MISNQILQDTIDGIKAITRIDLCVMDTEGKPLASTLDAVEEYKEAVLVFAESLAESQALQGYQFFKVFDENQIPYELYSDVKANPTIANVQNGCFPGTESFNCL